MIDSSNILLTKNIFWYLNKHPDTALFGRVPITKEILDTKLSTEPVNFWIPATPPDGESQNLNILEVHFPASTKEPLTVRGLMHYLYKHYNTTLVEPQHQKYIKKVGIKMESDTVRYIDLMKKNILFMGLQYIARHKVYHVIFMHTALT